MAPETKGAWNLKEGTHVEGLVSLKQRWILMDNDQRPMPQIQPRETWGLFDRPAAPPSVTSTLTSKTPLPTHG